MGPAQTNSFHVLASEEDSDLRETLEVPDVDEDDQSSDHNPDEMQRQFDIDRIGCWVKEPSGLKWRSYDKYNGPLKWKDDRPPQHRKDNQWTQDLMVLHEWQIYLAGGSWASRIPAHFPHVQALNSTQRPLEKPTPAVHPFTKLPLEIRQQIFSYVIGDPVVDVRASSRRMGQQGIHGQIVTDKTPDFTHPLLLVNESYRETAGHVFIRAAIFQVDSFPANKHLTAWLQTFAPGTGFSGIRNLSFPGFDFFPGIGIRGVRENADIKLMKMCPNLRQLWIAFATSNLLKPKPGVPTTPYDTVYVSCDHSQIVDRYELERLLELPKLESLTLWWIDNVSEDHWEIECEGTDYRVEPLHELQHWFQHKFEDRGIHEKEINRDVTSVDVAQRRRMQWRYFRKDQVMYSGSQRSLRWRN